MGDVAWSPRAGFFLVSVRLRPAPEFREDIRSRTTPSRMGMLGRPLDQTAVTTQYNADGTPAGPPALTTFTIPNAGLVLPRASNWTLDVDHQLSAHVYLTAKYLRRRGTDGFAFINTLAPDAPPSLLPLPNASRGRDLSAHESSPRQL